MILLIPISASDAGLLPEFTAAMLHCGSVNPHKIRIVPTFCVTAQGAKLAADLKPICDNITLAPLELDPINGWPHACSVHWQKALFALAREGLTEPVWWYELDNTCLVPRWMNLVGDDYNLQRKHFYGAVVPTFRAPRGHAIPSEAGRHMVGTGIYPAGWYQNPSQYMRIPFDEPFDVFFQDEWLNSCHSSSLIYHAGKTQKYRRNQGGQIICDDKDMPPGVSYNLGPVPPEAVVVHGCKDGSLSRLVCGIQPEPEAPVIKRGPGRPKKQPEPEQDWTQSLQAPTAA